MDELAVTILADGLQVMPGSHVSFKVEVRNLGSVVDRYFCDVLGLDPAWSTVSPASLELLPDSGRIGGQSGQGSHGERPTVGTFTVSIHPPRHPSALARSWPIALNVRSENDARIRRIEETSVAILPFGSIEALLTPSASRSRLSTTPTLRLENGGNQAEIVTYEGTDSAGRLDFGFSPPRLELKPGQAVAVKVKLSPSGSNLLGQAQTSSYSIQIRGSGLGTAPVAVSGSHAQLSLIPTQLPWFGAVVIALSMAGIAVRTIMADPVVRASPEASQGPATAGPSVVLSSNAASPTGRPSSAPPSASASAAPASSAPSPTPTPTPTLPPTPTATAAPAVADWALAKAQELSDAGHNIGSPVGVTQATTDGAGLVQRFQSGRVYRSPTGVVAAIRGGLQATWLTLAGDPGPVPQLGYPKAEEQLDSGNHPFQRFDKGVLQCSPGHCAYSVPNRVFNVWRDFGSTIGYPVKHGGSVSGGALGTQFDTGIIYVDPQTDFHAVCTLNGQVIHATSPISDCTTYAIVVKAMP